MQVSAVDAQLLGGSALQKMSCLEETFTMKSLYFINEVWWSKVRGTSGGKKQVINLTKATDSGG